jgi:hypothetical protein
MTEELDVLRIIGERLRAADIPFMLTGSFALGYYGRPRMTRDLDRKVRVKSAQGLLRGVTREYGSSPGRWSGR